MPEAIIIKFDGAAKGNPGPAGIGIIFFNEAGSVLKEISRFVGERTNNQAEYEALIIALEKVRDYRASRIILQTDSELLFRQIRGYYQVKNERLKKYHQRALKLLSRISNLRLEFTPRYLNRQADRLAKKAIKNYLKRIDYENEKRN